MGCGVYTLNWLCDPPEAGQSIITITVQGATTLRIVDDGIPGSFTAHVDPASPSVATGFFIDPSDAPDIYREDFVFTLAASGAFWTQNNVYEYFEGPSAGSGGVCGGTAVRQN